MIKFTRKILQ